MLEFNHIHPKLEFTIEKGNKKCINFLDITVIRKNNRSEFDFYRKPTAIDQAHGILLFRET
jgi:hypothetical protein